MEATPLEALPVALRDRSLEATGRERRGSAAAPAKPRRRVEERRKRVAGREEGALRDDRVREAEEEVVGMSEREVGDAAEAIVEKLKRGREDWIELVVEE